MYREPHAERDDKKVWLSTEEVEQFLAGIEDTDRRFMFGLGLRSGLRPGESIEITPEDVGRGPQGWMLHVPEPTAKNNKYRETPLPRELATTIRIVDDVRQEPSDAPLVDVSTRTLRRWVQTTRRRSHCRDGP